MELTTIFKALSDETRLRIIKLLEHGELCVCDIAAVLQSSQPKVSFHLSALKEAGLIVDRRDGRWIHYRLTETDMFRRFLMMAVFERLDADVSLQDRRRLEESIRSKQAGSHEGASAATCSSCS